MPEQVYNLGAMLSWKKIWSQKQIVIIPSWPLPWRQIRPCPLVVIAALHQLHQLLWLAEPLNVRVWVSIWGLSGPIRAQKETAEQHVYHRATTKGWKGEGFKCHKQRLHMRTLLLTQVNMQATIWEMLKLSSPTSLPSSGSQGGGHVDRYNLCSLALVESSLFLCATFMPLIDF